MLIENTLASRRSWRFLAPFLIALACLALGGARTQSGLSASGSGFAVQTLNVGATAFSNRPYVWQEVPQAFSGWQFTQFAGGVAAQIVVTPASDGDVYAASLNAPGGAWQAVNGAALVYNDKQHTRLQVYHQRVVAGTPTEVPQSGWAGAIVLAPSISLPTTATEAEPKPPGVVIDYLPADSGRYVGSPSIAILPDGTYVASHDIFGPGAHGDVTRIFRSNDRGVTWKQISELSPQTWSSLFVHRGALYLLGPDHEFGQIVIRKSTDGGQTWTPPSTLTEDKGMHCAPTPVVDHGGRLWRAFEWNPPEAGHKRKFRAFLLSAPDDADLLKAASWTPTAPLAYNSDETGGNWLEGNVVVAPDGSLDDILRIDKGGLERAAVLHLRSDGKALEWSPSRDRVVFPGGAVKFTIRFDPVSKRYWSLVNKQQNPDARRNVLALVSSPDLMEWTVEAVVLRHPDQDKHSFQYVDWLFDGDDIVAVSRTSWDGDTFHNANFLTFHRIMDFRSPNRHLAGTDGAAAVTDEPADEMGDVHGDSDEPAFAASNPAFRSEFIFTSAPFPSCHASTIVETANHTLVAAWFGGKKEGANDVKIWVSRLENGKWSPPALAATGVDEAGGPCACYNPVLFQPRGGGPLLLFYKVGHKPALWRGYVTHSDDDGRSWEPGRLLPPGFIGPDKDKPLQLEDGTILCGSADESDGWRVHMEFTDPLAERWMKTVPLNDSQRVQAIQPSLISLGGDRVLAIGRTAQEHLFSMESQDAGRNWTPMRLIDMPNPNAGVDTVHLRDGRFLLVYNPSTKNRKLLSVAISSDAEHWTKVLDLDHGPLQYSYPAAIQTSDGKVHIVYTWRRKRIRHVVLDPKLIP